jgi:hypothetical protein
MLSLSCERTVHSSLSSHSVYRRASLTCKGERGDREDDSTICLVSSVDILSAMRLFLLIAVWLTLSTVVYAFIVRSVLAHVHSVSAHIGVGVVFSAVLSPGVAVGHGVVPFPGGLMCLRMLVHGATYWRGTFFNLVFWALTATIFIAVTLRMRQQP